MSATTSLIALLYALISSPIADIAELVDDNEIESNRFVSADDVQLNQPPHLIVPSSTLPTFNQEIFFQIIGIADNLPSN